VSPCATGHFRLIHFIKNNFKLNVSIVDAAVVSLNAYILPHVSPNRHFNKFSCSLGTNEESREWNNNWKDFFFWDFFAVVNFPDWSCCWGARQSCSWKSSHFMWESPTLARNLMHLQPDRMSMWCVQCGSSIVSDHGHCRRVPSCMRKRI
jgi:hypothetical protein